MKIDGILFCDWCNCIIKTGEGTTVRVKATKKVYELHYHNRHENDCVANKFKRAQMLHSHGSENGKEH
ncbi:MAG TPA: hypothetical protein VKB38_13310 [Terracidiphilus sp.]|nr:hypothetical protein [Terracidiphilus sp.]